MVLRYPFPTLLVESVSGLNGDTYLFAKKYVSPFTSVEIEWELRPEMGGDLGGFVFVM
jgi:hypothetical protein